MTDPTSERFRWLTLGEAAEALGVDRQTIEMGER